ncbi:MAG: hypothetical protein ABIC95_01395 [archaeon]
MNPHNPRYMSMLMLFTIVTILSASLALAEPTIEIQCANHPGPDFCPGGIPDVISVGTDQNGCAIWACREYCADSDGGYNYDVKGYCEDHFGHEIDDYCNANGYLAEAYCSGAKTCVTTLKQCPNGCENGKCMPEMMCTDQYDPVCGSGPKTYSNACYALKAGAEVLHKGECVCEDYRYGNCPSDCEPRCVSSHCSGNVCTDDCGGPGSCVEPRDCEDSDGGKAWYTKGTTSTATGMGTDYCGGGYVYEWYCLNNQKANERKLCDYGCWDGACVESKKEIKEFSIKDGRFDFEMHYIIDDWYVDGKKLTDIDKGRIGGAAHTHYSIGCREGDKLTGIFVNPSSGRVWKAEKDISNYSCGGEQLDADVTFFVMSKCPYGTQVENTILPLLKRFDGAVSFDLEYVGELHTPNLGPTQQDEGLWSMHGVGELEGDMIELCVGEQYPDQHYDFLLCMNEDYTNIPDNWKSCASRYGISTSTIDRCVQYGEGEKLLRASFEKAKAHGVSGSPTMYFGDTLHNGKRDTETFQTLICDQIDNQHPLCGNDIPIMLVKLDQPFTLREGTVAEVMGESLQFKLDNVQAYCTGLCEPDGGPCHTDCSFRADVDVTFYEDGKRHTSRLILTKEGEAVEFGTPHTVAVKEFTGDSVILVVSKGKEVVQRAYLDKPFKLQQGRTAEVVDYGNMRITANKVWYDKPDCMGSADVACMAVLYPKVQLTISKLSGDVGAATIVTLGSGESAQAFGAQIRAESISVEQGLVTLLVTTEDDDMRDVRMYQDIWMQKGDQVRLVPQEIRMTLHQINTNKICSASAGQSGNCRTFVSAKVSLEKLGSIAVPITGMVGASPTNVGTTFTIKEGEVKHAFGVYLIFKDVDDGQAVFRFVSYQDIEDEDETLPGLPGIPVEEPVVPIEDEEADIPVPGDICIGCETENACMAIGIRTVDGSGNAVYCDVDSELRPQKERDTSCQNSFECRTNTCSSGVCIDIQQELAEQRGMLERILGWLSSLFGSRA